MVSDEPKSGRGYYFALPRLWACVKRRETIRSEQNWIEAYFAGLVVFLLSYATGLAIFRAGPLLSIALVFATWVAWLVVFYLNSVILDALRSAGIAAGITNSRAQNIFIGIETTACAIALAMQPRWTILGWASLLIIAANSAAAVVLRLASKRDA